MAQIAAHRRPHYPPTERMAILELRAARGWNQVHTAKAMLVTPATVAAWLRRIDERGYDALVQLSEPVNRFPDFVRYIVRRLKALCPSMGKVRIARVLARAGLHLAATTVGRILKGEPPCPDPATTASEDMQSIEAAATRVVTAKYPNHVWHVDLTTVPIAGFWVPWLPFALPQVWPFCWWVSVGIDHFSRRVMGVAAFKRPPTFRQVAAFLRRTIRKAGARPKYIICDKGVRFWCDAFKKWCKCRGIRPRFGAVGKHGSIAVIERFIRSMKSAGLRRTLVSFAKNVPARVLALCRLVQRASPSHGPPRRHAE
jgi:transposase InsO family protein